MCRDTRIFLYSPEQFIKIYIDNDMSSVTSETYATLRTVLKVKDIYRAIGQLIEITHLKLEMSPDMVMN